MGRGIAMRNNHLGALRCPNPENLGSWEFQEFHLDANFILLTITVHMAAQGIAPLIWMPICDYVGRRLLLIATLAIFVGANAGLLVSDSFLSLMLLRVAQALGSSHLSTTGETPLSLRLSGVSFP